MGDDTLNPKPILQFSDGPWSIDRITPHEPMGLPVVMDDRAVAVRGDSLGEVWWQGRQWAVTSDGIERRDGCYFIAADRLCENVERWGWPSQLAGKTWVDVEDFRTAWLVALALHGGVTADPDQVRKAVARTPIAAARGRAT